jgi:hypothetical protein
MNSYLDEFYNLACHVDVLQFFNNYKRTAKIHKELTESIGCYKAAIDMMKLDSNEERLVIVIGDGKFPRTASIFAHMTKWTCISIDPQLDIEWFNKYSSYKASVGQNIRRLECINSTIEDAKIDSDKLKNFQKFLVVFPHSHAKIKSSVTKLGSLFGEETTFDMINMPCCVEVPSNFRAQKFVKYNEYISYCDTNVISPKNTVHCWKNLTSNILTRKL